jgi:hypothetical protein
MSARLQCLRCGALATCDCGAPCGTLRERAARAVAENRAATIAPEQIDKPGRPELQKDENGLWPGQQHPLDIPDFLRRTPKPTAVEQHADQPQEARHAA